MIKITIEDIKSLIEPDAFRVWPDLEISDYTDPKSLEEGISIGTKSSHRKMAIMGNYLIQVGKLITVEDLAATFTHPRLIKYEGPLLIQPKFKVGDKVKSSGYDYPTREVILEVFEVRPIGPANFLYSARDGKGHNATLCPEEVFTLYKGKE